MFIMFRYSISSLEYDEDHFRMITIHNITISLYTTGIVECIRYYKNGKKHGLCKGYEYDGSIHYECSYKNGKRHGISRCYDEFGHIEREENFINGKKHGISKYYD